MQFCRTENVTAEMKSELEKRNGFIFNTSRRTAYFFSCDALVGFLKRNDLSHVVRAHEVQHVGFKASLNVVYVMFSVSRPVCASVNKYINFPQEQHKYKKVGQTEHFCNKEHQKFSCHREATWRSMSLEIFAALPKIIQAYWVLNRWVGHV